ncbi:MAG: hypothetical protein E6G82_16375 [Alphaproteobacteria bacterium]|nr:MAG: hypothetical protein E6G82_16375 [Alphaproteobacteria bacterium]
MARLILTTSDSGAGCLMQAGAAEIVIPFGFRFAWGRLPSAAEFASLMAPRSRRDDHAVPHWLDNFDRRRGEIRQQGLGLVELCQQCETVELWIDPDPNAQLMLVCLLDFFRSDGKAVSRLTLRQANVGTGNSPAEAFSEWQPPAVKILNDHVELASLVWRAYRQPTPQDWFDLLGRDLSVLPQLRQTALELLEELPVTGAGVGGTEMRMLELISVGNASPFDVFPGHRKPNKRHVFGYWEVGSLLDGLAHCPTPAVSGLEEGPFTMAIHEDRNRHERYQRSKLNLTPLGKAVLARTEDFSLHNPIHRWWGGTELNNHRLWRWDAANRALIGA